MTQITLKLKSGLDKSRENEITAAIGKLHGVFNFEAVFPDDSDHAMRLVYVADIDDSANAESVSSAILNIGDVEYAQPVGKRSLL
jgi:hypothetical protein